MSKLTKQQWAEVEEKLKRFFTPVFLECDGYRVRLMLERVSQFENAITVYVDGWMKGEWMIIKNSTEEGKRFFQVRSKAYVKEKEKKQLIKVFGVKKARKTFGIDKRYEWRSLTWKAFGSLKRHFITNNENIKLVEDDG